MRLEPHPLDIQLNRLDATYNTLLDAYIGWSHGVEHDLTVDIEVDDNFVALNLVTQMNLKMEPYPDPYLIDDHEMVQHRCKLYSWSAPMRRKYGVTWWTSKVNVFCWDETG